MKKMICIVLVFSVVLCFLGGQLILNYHKSKADKKPLTAKERLMNLRNETVANGDYSIILRGVKKK